MKTTLDIHDELPARAKRHARTTGRPLRAVVQRGLRRLLPKPPPRPRYRLADSSVADATASDPLNAFSWQHLRERIYGSPPCADCAPAQPPPQLCAPNTRHSNCGPSPTN